MGLLLSKNAFAARHGKGASAVSNWKARGILDDAAFTADGRVDVEEAERQLAGRLDTSRSLGRSAAIEAPAAMTPTPVPKGETLNSLQAIKLERERLELQRLQEQAEERKGRYVLADAIRREHTRELVQLISTVEQRLPELVKATAGLEGKAAVVAARRWWRELRQAEAVAARARAAEAPEFAVDRLDRREAAAPSPEAAHAA